MDKFFGFFNPSVTRLAECRIFFFIYTLCLSLPKGKWLKVTFTPHLPFLIFPGPPLPFQHTAIIVAICASFSNALTAYASRARFDTSAQAHSMLCELVKYVHILPMSHEVFFAPACRSTFHTANHGLASQLITPT